MFAAFRVSRHGRRSELKTELTSENGSVSAGQLTNQSWVNQETSDTVRQQTNQPPTKSVTTLASSSSFGSVSRVSNKPISKTTIQSVGVYLLPGCID
ncbi:hypothetical protein BaRGS_00014002 [Batillaria attramentaria]|uniref:Uncharacterized protein n=1 Tax=Batillaria attramentaria TaxID=370345 RepID=A0ABD0L6U8_9CAEN